MELQKLFFPNGMQGAFLLETEEFFEGFSVKPSSEFRQLLVKFSFHLSNSKVNRQFSEYTDNETVFGLSHVMACAMKYFLKRI